MGLAKPLVKRTVMPLPSNRHITSRWTTSLPRIRTLHRTAGSSAPLLNVDNEELVAPFSPKALTTDQLLDLLKNMKDAANLSKCLTTLEKTLEKRDPEINKGITTLDRYRLLVDVFGRLAHQLDVNQEGIVKIILIFKWLYNSDKRFNIVFRTCGGLKILSFCLRFLIVGHAKAYQSAGELLLVCCKSNASVQILWRSGTITSVMQHWLTASFSRLPFLLHLALRIANRLTEKSLAVPSFIAKGLTIALLRLIRLIWNGHFRNTSIMMKNFLNCIRNLLKTRGARNTFHEQHALSFIQEICRTTLSLELLEAGSAVLLAAFPPKKLPLSSMSHPLFLQAFQYPTSIKEYDGTQERNKSRSTINCSLSDLHKHEKEGEASCQKYDKDLSTERAGECQLVNLQSHPSVHVSLYSKYFPKACCRSAAAVIQNLSRVNLQFDEKVAGFRSEEKSHGFQLTIRPYKALHSSRFADSKKPSLSLTNNLLPLPEPNKRGAKSCVGKSMLLCPSLASCQKRKGSKMALSMSHECFFPYQRVAHPDTEIFDCLKSPNPIVLSEAMAPSTSLDEWRQILREEVERGLHPDAPGFINVIVYDAEEILRHFFQSQAQNFNGRELQDEVEKMRKALWPSRYDSLSFDSLFESGNLRKAIQVRKNEYDLMVFADVSGSTSGQWFYFQVTNMKANMAYRFNIINCQKTGCFFGQGMQPVVFSLKDATGSQSTSCLPTGSNGGWKRKGTNIAYYRNNYKGHGPPKMQGEECPKEDLAYFYTLTFTLEFDHDDDVVYVAYHYPYTYSTMQRRLKKWQEKSRTISGLLFLSDTLTMTLGGLALPFLTLTGSSSEGNCRKQLVFLTGRVHPSESNSSYVMDGILECLLSDTITSRSLLANFVFKIIPMLNPDGVVCGNSRSSLAGLDLNRYWSHPIKQLFPTIFHAKHLMERWRGMGRKVYMYVDCHGHSNQKNVFFYGCSPFTDWRHQDSHKSGQFTLILVKSKHQQESPETEDDHFTKMDIEAKSFPLTMKTLSSTISLRNCSYDVQESRESCARITVWRQFACSRSYTLESSFCGFDSGPFQGCQMAIGHLHQTGQDLIRAIYTTWISSKLDDDCFNAPLAL